MPISKDDALALLDSVIAKAKKAGAEQVDALLAQSTSLSHAQRLGEVEKLERSEEQDLGLRVLIGKKQAVVSSNDFDSATLDQLVERAVAMAKVVPDDPYCGLAEPAQLVTQRPDIDSLDPQEPAPERLIELARAAEEAARAVKGVTNSEGAEAGWGQSFVVLAGSNGFSGAYERSSHSYGVSVLAGEGVSMERDYAFSQAVYGGDLRDPAEVGREAGEQAVRRLGARRPKTGRYPVVFDPRVGNSLLRHFAGAINGAAIARGTSFLKDKLGEMVFADGINIIDDPHRPRGLASKPFDAEGLANRKHNLIENGRLTTWLLDLSTARQLGLESSGHASRGTGGPPHPSSTNLYLAPGKITRDSLIGEIKQGFYVTEMMGTGVNGVTGDYSRGAAGFWIENGEIAYPVSEATVAGNLKDMFAKLTPADDLVFRYGANTPTLRIDGATVAGGGA
ncbi:TldD/PmbA family protein [Limibacillus halophilus]|uniref:PmbA protein n=1 Tax=Limibacillus halophilus TaxID=1579333 RepID=A0A839SXC1_9PROT|nr:TldD/PmbA family protein [Limibacillus halophilus]MBB3066719.1 PmbA protein [Limibacillus halophilus]